MFCLFTKNQRNVRKVCGFQFKERTVPLQKKTYRTAILVIHCWFADYNLNYVVESSQEKANWISRPLVRPPAHHIGRKIHTALLLLNVEQGS